MSLRDQLSSAITVLPGVSQRKSRFSENPGFYFGKREIAHFHADNVIDIRLTRPAIRELSQNEDKDPRLTIRGSSEWVEFAFSRSDDLVRALELVEGAVAANG